MSAADALPDVTVTVISPDGARREVPGIVEHTEDRAAMDVLVRLVAFAEAHPEILDIQEGIRYVVGDALDLIARRAPSGLDAPGAPEPTCDGRCIWATDLGVLSNALAYPDPECSLHGTAAQGMSSGEQGGQS